MADKQHSNILDAECHEPKHITNATTSDAGKIITPSGSTSGVSTLRQLKTSELDTSSEKSLFTFWGIYHDATYTTGSRQSVSSGVRTKLTIDGAGSDTDTNQLPGGVDLWDTTNNKITPANENDAYSIRLDLQVEVSTSGNYVDFELDIGGATGVIVTETKAILKSSTTMFLSVNWSFPANSVFLSNGGELYITPNAAIETWGHKLFINKTHTGG